MGSMEIHLSLCPASAFKYVSAFKVHTSERTGNHAIRLSNASTMIQSHQGYRKPSTISESPENQCPGMWQTASPLNIIRCPSHETACKLSRKSLITRNAKFFLLR